MPRNTYARGGLCVSGAFSWFSAPGLIGTCKRRNGAKLMRIHRGRLRLEDASSAKWWPRMYWYWIPKCGRMYRRLYVVWLNRYWWFDS